MKYKYSTAIADYEKSRASWARWLSRFGAAAFFDSFMRIAQDAKSTCIHCHQPIYLDIAEGGGVPDWRTEDGDYGCFESPDSTNDGCGGHKPETLE